MNVFDEADLDDASDLPEGMDTAIIQLFRAWPNLELALTVWIAFATGVRASETAIILGAMDVRTKIEKLKALYTHRNDPEAVSLLKVLAKGHTAQVRKRNTIAHATFLGRSKTDPSAAYFFTARAVSDREGAMQVVSLNVAALHRSRDFAREASETIRNLLEERGSKDVARIPEDHPPKDQPS